MQQPTGLRTPPPALRRWAAASLAAGLLVVGCAPSPVAFQGPTDVRTVEVALAEAPAMEVYYHRHQPPGLLNALGSAAFMGTIIIRSYADSQKTKQLEPHLAGIKPAEEMAASFVATLREAGVFRRVERRGALERNGFGGLAPDAVIEIEVERWGPAYAAEEALSAQVVVVGRMRPSASGGEALLWRRRLVETDGARAVLEELATEGETLREALRRTLRAAGADLARDLASGRTPQYLLPPKL